MLCLVSHHAQHSLRQTVKVQVIRVLLMIMPDDIVSNIERLFVRIAAVPDADVRVLIATKTQLLSVIGEALSSFRAQSRNLDSILLGENRVQELVDKAEAITQLPQKTELHLIGHLQKNKINQLLATPVTCVQTVDSFELAQALSERCERLGRDLEVMIQVNVSDEPGKAGCKPTCGVDLASQVATLPNLTLTGFMCIGPRPILTSDSASPKIVNEKVIRDSYRVLREIRDEVFSSNRPGTQSAKELSMGMTSDLELAIAEGATIVRIGTGIFGSRQS
jgi:PLP dependent protein